MSEHERTTDFEIVEMEAQPTVAVRLTLNGPGIDLAPVFGQWLPAVAEAIVQAGGEIGAPAFGRYHRFGKDLVDVEIGFGIAEAGEGFDELASLPEGRIGLSELPDGWAAWTVYRGPYDGLAAVYDALADWIDRQPGCRAGSGPWESYLDAPDPGADMSTIRTAVVWPVIGS